jgi:SAM-dependent methyltransferase
MAAPMLSALGETGLVERICFGPFLSDDLTIGKNAQAKATTQAVIKYLSRLGIVDGEGTTAAPWIATEDGRKILRRWGSAAILESYREYAAALPALLNGSAVRTPMTDRPLNVLGSGALHKKKFFPAATSVIESSLAKTLVDVGCGDGTFLLEASKCRSLDTLVGVDLSAEAVSIAEANVGSSSWEGQFVGAAVDARQVKAWSACVPATDRPPLISMWFILHEFCQGSVDVAATFFSEVRTYLPEAEFLLGEIVCADAGELREGRDVSIMPEYLFFHDLSGQTVLTWPDLQRLQESIPYRVKDETLFDRTGVTGTPSALFWHLIPG